MQNISLIGTVVLEKKSFERFFLPYMGMALVGSLVVLGLTAL